MTNRVCNTVMIPVEEYEALCRQVEELSGMKAADAADTIEALHQQVDELLQVAEAKEPFVLDLVRQRDALRAEVQKFEISYTLEKADHDRTKEELLDLQDGLTTAYMAGHAKGADQIAAKDAQIQVLAATSPEQKRQAD